MTTLYHEFIPFDASCVFSLGLFLPCNHFSVCRCRTQTNSIVEGLWNRFISSLQYHSRDFQNCCVHFHRHSSEMKCFLGPHEGWLGNFIVFCQISACNSAVYCWCVKVNPLRNGSRSFPCFVSWMNAVWAELFSSLIWIISACKLKVCTKRTDPACVLTHPVTLLHVYASSSAPDK